MSILITGAKIIAPDASLPDSWLLIEDGRISEIGSEICPPADTVINGQGYILMPGLIDLHSDAIEQEINPRPGAMFDIAFALSSLESKLLAHGTTTIFHSISCNDNGKGVRSKDYIRPFVETLDKLKKSSAMHNFIHIRYDICEYEFGDLVMNLMDEGLVQLLSFMDHSPGQGQYASIESFLTFLKRHRGLSDSEAMLVVDQQRARAADPMVPVERTRLAARARELAIPIASHDDDSPEKSDIMHKLGMVISEFPITLETARHARAKQLCVLVGAPNVLKRKSNSGNLSALDAIATGAANALCSDYVPTSMLQAVFDITEHAGLPLHEAVALATKNPAAAVGLGDETGSLNPGLNADLLLVRLDRGRPAVDLAMVGGRPALVRGNIAASLLQPDRIKV